MATTDYDFNVTRTEIINRAFSIIGVRAPGQSVSSNASQEAVAVLNAMVARWQSDHIFLWTQTPITVTLIADQASYSFSDDPQVLSVDKAFLRRTSGSVDTDTELEIEGWDDYQDLPTKTTQGDPNSVYIKLSDTSGTVYTYPVVHDVTNKSLILFCTVKLKDFDTSTANPNVRTAWIDALSYGLASQICDDYSIPISEREYISNKAAGFYAAVKKTDKQRPDYMVMRSAYD